MTTIGTNDLRTLESLARRQGVHHDVSYMVREYLDEFPDHLKPSLKRLAQSADENIRLAKESRAIIEVELEARLIAKLETEG